MEERDKDVGLGVFNAGIALGASIPAPILFGWAIGNVTVLYCHKVLKESITYCKNKFSAFFYC